MTFPFNYSEIKNQKWDSDILGLIAAIYKAAVKQEMYLKQRPEELDKPVEIAKNKDPCYDVLSQAQSCRHDGTDAVVPFVKHLLELFLLLIRILKIALRRWNLNEKAQEKIFAITVGNHVYIRYDSCKFNPLAFVALIPQGIRKFQGAESRLANTKFSYLNHIVTSVRRGKRQTMRT